MKVNIGGKSVDAVGIYVGGRTGPQAKEGRQIMEMVPCDDALPDVLATVIKHWDLFKQVEPLRPGERDRILMVPAGAVDEPAYGMEVEGAEMDSKTGAAEHPRAGRVKVCQASELGHQSGRLVTVHGKALALFRVNERIVAMDAECPHEGGPLQEGAVESGCVVCPWHAYRFDVKSGRCATDEHLGVKTYPTSIENGTVWVEVPTCD